MKLTIGESKIVEDIHNGWILEGHTAWDSDGKYCPYGMRLLRGEEPHEEFKRVHQGICKRLFQKGIIRVRSSDLYFIQWEVRDKTTEGK
jgi:hypothetical protein